MANGREGYPNFVEQIALGIIDGYESFRKFGVNPVVNGTGTPEDVSEVGGLVTWPTTAAVASVSSSEAADDGDPAGTGARTVTVSGLDENYLEVSESVTMNGTSAVTTTQTFLRVNRAYVVGVGTAGFNVGAITITVGGNAQVVIAAERGQTASSLYTVPANKYLLITQFTVGVGRMAGSSDANIEGKIRLYDETSNNNYNSWRAISNVYLFSGQEHVDAKSATLIPPRADMRAEITSSATTQAHAIYGGYLIDSNMLAQL
jgi:hypothetical protein